MRKLGIFDVNEAKIVRYVPVAEDEIAFAGGMKFLMVYLPGAKLLQRYSLETGEREASAVLDVPGTKVESFAMGHASAGPLLISVSNGGSGWSDQAIQLYDPNPDKPKLLLSNQTIADDRQNLRLEGGIYWASATGRVFGSMGNSGGQPNGIRTLQLWPTLKSASEHQGTWFVMPGPDDQHIYPGGYGVLDLNVKPVSNVAFSGGGNSGFASHLYLPAAHGPFYLHAMTIDFDSGPGPKVPQGTIRLFALGDKEPIAVYDKTVVYKYGWEGVRGLGIENSIQLIPKAKLLVVVPSTRDELRLYPADLEASLRKSNRDFLIFTSTPPTTCRKGQPFTYTATALGKNAPLAHRIETGPKGMMVDASGKVTWPVPADFAESRADAILAVKDANGREAFQTLTLTASEK